MLTPWGEALDKNAVLQEYPRPQLVRESYYNLNGLWDYAITASDACPGAWDGEILVPFSPEAPLSGVGRILKPGQVLWYRRTLPFAKPDGGRMLLHIGAADQRAWVYVNGLLAGTHTGGYTAFTLDMTKLLRDGENILTVAVRDDTDAVPLSRGKQKTKRGGIWYTPQSGIWQTVWAEHVPENYVQALLFTPELPEGRVRWRLAAPAPKGARIEISYQGTPVGSSETDEDGYGSAVLPPEQLHLWSPEAPNLYDVTITLGDDTVRSYFAMRTVGTGKDAAGHPCLLLNGQPYFHHGVLDQGYWPDGLYTAPSDEALIYDITLMKRLGFNMLRKHIKIEPMRWYYHCDRLGMLVWQDMPSGGGQYNLLTISAPLITGVHLKDSHYTPDVFTQELLSEDLTPGQRGKGLWDDVRAVHLVPDAFTPFHWKLILDRGSVWDVAGYTVFTEEPQTFVAYAKPPQPLWAELAAKDRMFRAYERFALYPALEAEIPLEGPLEGYTEYVFSDLRFGSTIGWVDDIQVRRHGKPTTFRIMARVAPDGTVSAVRFITTTGAGGDSGWNPPVE